MKFAVTGWAWRTALGADVQTVCERVWARNTAHVANRLSSHYPSRRVAPILSAPAKSRNQRLVCEIALHAIEVADEAFAMAQCQAGDRMGLYAGMGGLRAGWQELMPAMRQQEASASGSWQRGLRSMHPLWMLRYLSNNAHGIASARLGIRGEGLAMSGPQAGAQAYRAATRALRLGAIDRALIVAYDTLLAPELLIAPPHEGHVPGEAAVAIVIQAQEQKGLQTELATWESEITATDDSKIIDAMGHLGAAMSLVQQIILSKETP